MTRRTGWLLVTAAALASATAACSDDAGESAGAGSSCDPAESSPCGDGLVCVVDAAGAGQCTFPDGAPCDASLPNGGCRAEARCVAAPASSSDEGGGGDGSPGTDGARCLLAEGTSCDPDATLCSPELACEQMADGGAQCHTPLVFEGVVTDSETGAPVADAQVIALDDVGFAVSGVAHTDASGRYALTVPATREADGSPVSAPFTLAASADGYARFPSGIRVALPIDASEAVPDEGAWVVDGALTRVALIALEEDGGATVSGTLAAGPLGRGALVVATDGTRTITAIADLEGRFTLFNVPAGELTVSAYAAGVVFETTTITVGDEALDGVTIARVDGEGVTVSGNIQLVNAPGGAATSVILVVEDTFDELAARGETPRGLRAPASGPVAITGDFAIAGVPPGSYVVLAAYENDGLVRDPDTNIGGTSFARVEVASDSPADLTVETSFKVTEALAVVGPGAEGPERVTAPVTLRWADDSSEDWYDVAVYDAFGDLVWESRELPGVSGGDDVTLTYEGPLEPGMYYQFRVTSWRAPGGKDPSPISATEDLRGVFFTD